MSIERITITDFQSIESLDAEVGPITVFYGESDTGKSALVRALYALAFNSYPSGHVRDGAQDSLVEVAVDGKKVRARKGKLNQYELDDPGTEMVGWDRVGTEVPEEVTELLGWRVMEIDDGTRFTPNFDLQFDPPFLITESPSRKAKLLGSLTNVAILYAAIKAASSRERKANQSAKTWGEIAEKAEEKKERLQVRLERARGYADKVAKMVKVIKDLDREAQEIANWLSRITLHNERAQANRERLATMEADVDLANLSELLSEATECAEIVAKLDSLQSVFGKNRERYEAVRASLADYRAEVEKYREENPMCPLCGNDWTPNAGHVHEQAGGEWRRHS